MEENTSKKITEKLIHNTKKPDKSVFCGNYDCILYYPGEKSIDRIKKFYSISNEDLCPCCSKKQRDWRDKITRYNFCYNCYKYTKLLAKDNNRAICVFCQKNELVYKYMRCENCYKKIVSDLECGCTEKEHLNMYSYMKANNLKEYGCPFSYKTWEKYH